MSPKHNNHIWQSRPPGSYYKGERIDQRPGETFGEALLRHQNANSKAMAQSAPKPASEPDRRAAQDANAKELKALADDTAKLRAAVDSQSPAAPPSEPVAKRTGFASRIKVARAFGGKHPQKSE